MVVTFCKKEKEKKKDICVKINFTNIDIFVLHKVTLLRYSVSNFLTWAGVSTGLGVLFLLICIWWLYKVIKRRKEINLKKTFFKRNGGLLLQQ